jgi:hypothetical protein
MSRAQFLLEVIPEGTGLDVDERRWVVDLEHALKTATIETHAAEDGHGAAADATATTGGRHGHAGVVAAPEHSGDFGGAGGSGDHPGPGRHGT